MKHSRIYILPTRFGFVFIAGAILMILIGSAYQNNLVNILAFFMLSLIFVCMLQTHNNLKDVWVEALETEGGFAGGRFLATTVLANGAKEPRYNLETRLHRLKEPSHYDNVLPLPELGTIRIKSTYPALTRGRHQVNRVRVASSYPLGLFEAWAWFNIAAEYYVYPELKGDRPFPAGSGIDDLGHISHPLGGDDFHGHRKFKEGDSHRHIDWKAFARGRPRLVKEFTEGAPGSAVLDWDALNGLDSEARLSQLANWVDEARNRKIVFALKLPDQYVPANHGLEHATSCWQRLADFKT